MQHERLAAHSLAEAYLYLMATPCTSCGRGPLRGSNARITDPANGPPSTGAHRTQTAAVEARCGACRTVTVFTFRIPQQTEQADERLGALINPTDEPSRILDVGQWIMLFRVITEAAGKEKDKIQARHLGIEAAQCLEEALKFYDDPGNDLPPPEAIFTEPSQRRLREAPEHFSRRRLIELRAKLPTMSAMRASLSKPRKKPWWRRRG
jgi:hypothetical protein